MLKKILKFGWLVAIAIVVVIAIAIFIGWYLSPQDKLQKTDAIVVISGGDNDARITKGVELYKAGWAKVIIFSGAAASGDVSNARAMANIAEKNGIPAAHVLLEENSKTTEQNAQFCAVLIKQKGFKSIILVTSPYHQRRAYELFKEYLPKGFTIVNQSSLDPSWRKVGWWNTGMGRLLTFGEFGKIIVNYTQQVVQKK